MEHVLTLSKQMRVLLSELIGYAEGSTAAEELRRQQRHRPSAAGSGQTPEPEGLDDKIKIIGFAKNKADAKTAVRAALAGTAPSQLNNSSGITEGENEMPSRLKYGQGTISKRCIVRKGVCYYYWYGRYMDNGRQRTVTAKSQAECMKKLKEGRARVRRGEKKLENPVYGEWLQKWYETYKVPFLKERSLSSVETCMRLHIPAALKRRRMDSITGLDLQEALNSVKFSRQKDIVYQIFCSSFKKAKQNGLIKNEPYLALEYKKHKSAKSNILTFEQQALIFKDARPELRRAILGYLWTGCRLRELLAIQWKDIDLEKRKILIRGTKSESSLRTVPLFDELAAVLGKPGAPDELVFNHHPDWISAQFRKLCLARGIDGLTIHSLRHTFGSRMRTYGVDFKAIQLMLGHSSIKVTMDIYVHEIEEFEAKILEKVNQSGKKSGDNGNDLR